MFRSLLAAMLLWLAALVPAAAQPLRLATGNDYAPFADAREQEGGVAIALVREAFANVGREVLLTYTTWARALEETRLGRFDATAPFVPSPERQAVFHYSSVLLPIDSFVMTSSGRDPDQPLAALIGESSRLPRSCLPLGWNQPVLRPLLEQGRVERVEAQQAGSCLKMLLAGRADYFIVNKPVAWHLIRNERLIAQQFRFSQRPVANNSLHLIIPLDRPDSIALMADFERGLAMLRASGRAQILLARLAMPG